MKLECPKCREKAVILLPISFPFKSKDSLMGKIMINLLRNKKNPQTGRWNTLCEKCGHKGVIFIN
ncbi:MAG: hypothetical protein LBS44_05510 [Deltaproteobacteria bacterium]|jgi:ribosomal protein S27E|nr:hypothetical protein [Deltaproteobacteria bacterium]